MKQGCRGSHRDRYEAGVTASPCLSQSVHLLRHQQRAIIYLAGGYMK
ncbi:TPA: hypothetical protein NIU59_005918 [Klebsiella michiganensis]|nr:hypothetical protein [Klebsiella michiganensis]HCF8068937.1 hypothetical protein [Klebsiella michiganensis]HCF8068967.1 hypothetical protein [Klebsiella michiganensis]